MGQPAIERTTVSVYMDVYERLSALRRRVNATEQRDLTLSETIGWMLDRLDVLDLP